MDVMVFTPVLRLESRTVEALMGLRWAGPLTLVMQRDNPIGNGREDHLHQYQRGRDLFLRGDYEAMLVIESDVVPPAETLERLAGLDVDLAYGCYVFRTQDRPVVNVFERYAANNGLPARNMGESLSVRGLWGQAMQQGVVDCSGGGLGCILIKRHVIEARPFEKLGPAFFDSQWTEGVYRAGYSMKADALLRCGHVDVDGTVLWPERMKGEEPSEGSGSVMEV